MIKETSALEKIALNTIAFSKKHKYILAGSLAGIFLLLSGLILYTRHINKLENELSVKVNDLVRKWKTIEAGNASFSELPSDVATELTAIYNKNKNTINGKRALFTAALILHKNGEFDAATEKYKIIYTKSKKHYCAPQSMLNTAIIFADRNNSKEAISLLKEFKELYITHFLYGESVLLLADIYALSGDYQSAEKTLKELSENSDLSAYAQKASENLNTLAIKRRYLYQ